MMLGYKRNNIFLIMVLTMAMIMSLIAKTVQAEWQYFDPINTNEILTSYHITGLERKGDSSIWVATDRELAEFNIDIYTTGINPWTLHYSVDNPNTNIVAIDVDSNGIVWIGENDGLVSYNPDANIVLYHNPPDLTEFSIEDIDVDANYVWVANVFAGVNRYDKSANWVIYENDVNGFNAPSARAVESDGLNTLWALPGYNGFFTSGHSGIYKFDHQNNDWNLIVANIGDQEVSFGSLFITQDNELWLESHEYGLWHYDIDTNILVHIDTNTWDAIDPPSIEEIQCFGVDGEYKIVTLFSAESGIIKYNYLFNLWQTIDTEGAPDILFQNITQILVNSEKNQIWFGTDSGGIYRLIENSISWSYPENGSENIPLDLESIEFKFSKPLSYQTLRISIGNLTISKRNDGQDIPFEASDFNIVWIDPNVYTHLKLIPTFGELDPNFYYDFRFGTNILDYVGSQIRDYTLTFKTIIDESQPSIINSVPANNATNVDPNGEIKIWFDREMDTSSFFTPPTKIRIRIENTSQIEIYETDTNISTINNKTLLIINKQLDSDTNYVLTITKDISDTIGNIMLNDFDLSFRTKHPPSILDDTYPKPQPNTQNVSIDANIVVRFSDSMNTVSVMNNFSIMPYVEGNFVWIDDNKEFCYRPLAPLSYDTEYIVQIGANAEDADGLSLVAGATWTFRTLHNPNDTTQLLYYYPEDDDTSISIYAGVLLVFDRPMDTNSVVENFSLSYNSNNVACVDSWNSDNTKCIFYPSSPLLNNQLYSIGLSQGAESANGISLSQDFQWSFTTRSTIADPYEPPNGGNWPVFPIDIEITGGPSLTFSDPNLLITAMALDESDGIWLGLAYIDQINGLGLFHFDGQEWEIYTDTDGLPSNTITDLEFDSDWNLWIGTPNNLVSYDRQAFEFYTPEDFEGIESLDPGTVMAFSDVKGVDSFFDGYDDYIWVATSGGIVVGRFNDGLGEWEWTATADFQFINTLYVNPMNGNVWFDNRLWSGDIPCESVIGIYGYMFLDNILQWPNIWNIEDLWIVNPTALFRSPLNGQNIVRSIYEDTNSLWVGTNSGLFKININSLIDGECNYAPGALDQFSTNGGLLSDSVYEVKMNIDDPSHLFVSTDQGISIYTLGTDITNPDNWSKYPFIETGGPIILMEFLQGDPNGNNGGLLVAPGSGFFIVGDIVKPHVIINESNPYDNGKGVPIDPVLSNIKVVFSELIDPDTLAGALSFSKSSGGDVPLTWQLEGKILEIIPDAPMDVGTEYNLTVDNSVTDLVGNSLSSTYNIQFLTARDLVSQTTPADGATNQSISGLNMVIEFVEGMDTGVTYDAICLNTASDSNCIELYPFWSNNNTTLTLAPLENLSEATTYILTVSKNAQTAQGEEMVDDSQISFTTALSGIILGTIPEDGQRSVPVNSTIEIEFTVAMNETLTGNAVSLANTSTPSVKINGTVSWDTNSRVLSFDPVNDLEYGTHYIFTIGQSAQTAQGQTLLDDLTVEFWTILSDVVLSTYPTGGMDVPCEGLTISVEFSLPMNTGVTGDAICLAPEDNQMNCVTDGDLVWPDNHSYEFSPDALLEDTNYTLTIGTDAETADGLNIPTPITISFRTSPIFIGTSPQDGTDNVPVGTSIIVEFTVPMNTTVTRGSFALFKEGDDANKVTGAITWVNDNKKLEFTPTNPLSENTTYTIWIYQGAQTAQGQNLGQDYNAVFETRTEPKPQDKVLKFSGSGGCFITTLDRTRDINPWKWLKDILGF